MESRLKFSIVCKLCQGIIPSHNYDSHLFGHHNITTEVGINHNSDGFPSAGDLSSSCLVKITKDEGTSSGNVQQESEVDPGVAAGSPGHTR